MWHRNKPLSAEHTETGVEWWDLFKQLATLNFHLELTSYVLSACINACTHRHTKQYASQQLKQICSKLDEQRSQIADSCLDIWVPTRLGSAPGTALLTLEYTLTSTHYVLPHPVPLSWSLPQHSWQDSESLSVTFRFYILFSDFVEAYSKNWINP